MFRHSSEGPRNTLNDEDFMAEEMPMPKTTAVDGEGMWRSWTRVFEKPESACLDLLDNCLDAALHEGFHGRVVMKPLDYSNNCAGISIMNNSQTPIKKLKEDVLVVYKSNKNSAKAIGENGVGLKHGCATLSNTSFVLTRNGNIVEIGVIAKKLQSPQGVSLPSFSFQVKNPMNKSELNRILKEKVNEHQWMLKLLSRALGQGSIQDGIDTLESHVREMFHGEWQHFDHIFQLIICKLHHSSSTEEIIDVDNPTTSRAKLLLQNIKQTLPRHYINIPSSGFDFVVDDERVQFSYWQRRLVELTEFKVFIPKEKAIEDLPESSWQHDGYPLSIYCGFDAQRVKRDVESDNHSTCMLYIYSRQPGRLVTTASDARAMLGMSTTGSDYMQGMTIIIDDINAQLPLMPTKAGIAWSEQKGGETHHRNLNAWAGAVGSCYWREHFKRFASKEKGNRAKDHMKHLVLSFVKDQLPGASVFGRITEDMQGSDFTRYDGLKWRRNKLKFGDLAVRRKPDNRGILFHQGSDTLFKITDERTQEILSERMKLVKASPNKNKRSPAENSTSADTAAAAAAPRDIEESDAFTTPRSSRREVSYVDFYTDKDEDEGPVIPYTPSKGRSKKKARLDTDTSSAQTPPSASSHAIEQKLLETEIKLKEEQLEKLKTAQKLQAAESALQQERENARKLEAKLKRSRNSGESENSFGVGSLQIELETMRAERDRYKQQLKQVSGLRADVKKMKEENEKLKTLLYGQGFEV